MSKVSDRLKALDPACVKAKALLGCDDKTLAELFALPEKAFMRKFGTVIRQARAELRAEILELQLKSARAGGKCIQQWLGAQFLGQTSSGPKEELEKPSENTTIKLLPVGEDDEADEAEYPPAAEQAKPQADPQSKVKTA
jgi:hypothetical protein